MVRAEEDDLEGLDPEEKLEYIQEDADDRMAKSVTTLEADLATIRTGRANPSMLAKIKVEYYGAATPLQQLASVTAPDAETLMVSPFDPSVLGEIERAILNADLGLTPSEASGKVRVAIPPLTKERRLQMSKQVGKEMEECKKKIRNIRQSARKQLDKLKDDISEDTLRDAQDELQKLTDKSNKKIEAVCAAKKKDLETM